MPEPAPPGHHGNKKIGREDMGDKGRSSGSLGDYRRKRRFDRTAEPEGAEGARAQHLFVVQKHAARRLHYDLRLQFGDVLKSWAVTRPPSFDPRVRRLAVHVEDHPLDYANFEGAIPAGEYGAGHVLIWDRGTWVATEDPDAGFARGVLKFRLSGEKLCGGWTLVRLQRQERQDNWLLIKERDIFAREETAGEAAGEDGDADADARSVVSGKTLAELRAVLPLRSPAPPAKGRPPRQPRPEELPGARMAALPDFVPPQLASLRVLPAEGAGWLHEIKLDGYRTLARIDGDRVTLLTRNGLDWTDRYGVLGEAFRQLKCRQALLDGEILVQDQNGVSHFSLLQEALASARSEALLFYGFDIIYLDGHDLQDVPLEARKTALADLLAGLDAKAAIQFSEHVGGDGGKLLDEGCRMGIEGIISKRFDAPYRPGRSRTWLKCKCIQGGDFVIIGFTRSEAAGGLAALLLAEEVADGLHYVGKVGTGFSRPMAADVEARLSILAVSAPCLAVPREARLGSPIWVEPRLLAEVRFASRTSEGRLRHASFRGLRPDKAAAVAEPRKKGEQTTPAGRYVSDADLAGVWVTNPDRVMFGGPSKLDLALYYARVGDWMLAELIGRPLTLVRCPNGRAADCFYQRRATAGMPETIKRLTIDPPAEEEEPEEALFVENAAGLLALAQFGVVEFHCRGCRVAAPEQPDRLVFDLDPDEGLPWREVVAAAFFVRGRIEDLGLAAFVKTTGGKGLHVVLPLLPRHHWPDTFAFAEGFSKRLAKEEPARFTSNMAKKQRTGRIFIDYLRNGRTASAVAAYSLRARDGVPVATPVSWNELADLETPRAFDYRTVPERLARLAEDPWQDLATRAGVITREAAAFAGLNNWQESGTENGRATG